ncbi:MAG: MerR family transcriptional regulator [Bdellovibrio sp. CG10_big_fil_rev_8_21_14_0_10_47_8]|nr:MAG: MerR family transcriptional regulator [Bdellovibrio sp. CG10_big_fil_rev_8_21_14_0_10_47_8]
MNVDVPTEAMMSLPAALCDEALLEEINSIPTKMGFKIGEVADMLGIKQYVLRYWESEFEVLKPKKASNNQRYYTRKDVENAYLIRKLLHRDRFSIEGARGALKDLKSFVRSEVKKDREISSMTQKIEGLQDQFDDILIQIRKIKRLVG